MLCMKRVKIHFDFVEHVSEVIDTVLISRTLKFQLKYALIISLLVVM